jgi:protein involved in polysaccharide export with SLBB domain
LLKSEAIPLAAVLAEAQPLRESARVTVKRNGVNQIFQTDLRHTTDLSFLVQPGDVVTLDPEVDEVFYIGGKVKFPGEKKYRLGLTLTQVIITAGGATSNSKVAEIIRDGEMPTRVDLNAIDAGKAVDPLVKAKDRIILH